MDDIRAAYLKSDEFLQFARAFMHDNNLTEFRACDNVQLAEDGLTVQGFVPCPWPYHGVGTFADPAAACQLGQSASAALD